jgi:uncharacterized membrane protein
LGIGNVHAPVCHEIIRWLVIRSTDVCIMQIIVEVVAIVTSYRFGGVPISSIRLFTTYFKYDGKVDRKAIETRHVGLLFVLHKIMNAFVKYATKCTLQKYEIFW